MQNKEFKTKAKVGRPKFQLDYLMEYMSNFYFDIKTRKGKQNKCYEMHAIGAIWKRDDVGDISFLFNPTDNVLQSSILVRLGRLLNEDGIRTVAKQICVMAKTEKHTVREWEKICYDLSFQYVCKMLG